MGNVRYDRATMTLRAQNVTLHAYRVELDNHLQLGSLEMFEFNAPISASWTEYLGMQKVRV
jgi:hypothetical protein